jgi:regulator of replication initiation timing
MRLEDVQSLVRHVLHLRAQVRELQAIGTDLIEENRALRSEASPKEERGET